MILLTGGTGTAGSEISKALQRMGVRYRSLVRNRAKAEGSANPNVELVEGDLSRPETLGAALEGVEKALLLTASSPDSLQQERNFIHAAKRAGVRHVVKFSAYGAGLDAPHYFGRQHGEAERELEDSGLPFTMLRPNGFFQNFLGNATSIQTRSALHAPAGEMKFSAVDARDIAAVAAHVLTEDGHAVAAVHHHRACRRSRMPKSRRSSLKCSGAPSRTSMCRRTRRGSGCWPRAYRPGPWKKSWTYTGITEAARRRKSPTLSNAWAIKRRLRSSSSCAIMRRCLRVLEDEVTRVAAR